MKAEGCHLKAIDVEKIAIKKFNEDDDEEHIMKMLFGSGFYAAFRGSEEHTNFSRSQVSFGVYPENYENAELAGKRYVAISNFPSDKTRSITVTNSYARDTQQVLRFPIDMNCMKSFGGTIARFMEKLSPGQTRMYCQVASPSYREQMALKGHPKASFYPTKQLGRKSITKYFKRGAKILGLPENFCPHSLRSACITQLVNDQSVSIAETMAVARHTSVSASKTYQRVDGVSEGNRLRALGLLESSTSASKKVAKVEEPVAAPEPPTAVPAPEPPMSVPVPVPPSTVPVPVPPISVSVPAPQNPVPDPRSVSKAVSAVVKKVDSKTIDPDEQEWLEFRSRSKDDSSIDDTASLPSLPPAPAKNLKSSTLCSPKATPSSQISMTQVGIQQLEKEVEVLQVRMAKTTPRPVSKNQHAINELRKVVKNLKRKLDDRENDILIYRSVENDRDEEIVTLKDKLEREKARNFELERELHISENKRRKLERENSELERIVFGGDRSGRRGGYFSKEY